MSAQIHVCVYKTCVFTYLFVCCVRSCVCVCVCVCMCVFTRETSAPGSDHPPPSPFPISEQIYTAVYMACKYEQRFKNHKVEISNSQHSCGAGLPENLFLFVDIASTHARVSGAPGRH